MPECIPKQGSDKRPTVTGQIHSVAHAHAHPEDNVLFLIKPRLEQNCLLTAVWVEGDNIIYPARQGFCTVTKCIVNECSSMTRYSDENLNYLPITGTICLH